jgi:mRNA-degrading endonuclease RelE of RelBE toxin-antitoxin system
VAYRIIVLPSAETDLEKLDPDIRRRTLRRIVWLGENALQIVHHQLVNMPDDLAGLCRLRAGDYRILYWNAPQEELLKIYRIQHRSEVYRHL